MPQLYITQIKPNPLGKDRSGLNISNQQLAGEWVDFKNTSGHLLYLDGIFLQHIAYTQSHPSGIWETAKDFTGSLRVNEIVRVHSGGRIDPSSLREIDRIGAHHHVFTGKGYIWNNDRSDSPKLIRSVDGLLYEIDQATYAARPTEGKIFVRSGNNLI